MIYLLRKFLVRIKMLFIDPDGENMRNSKDRLVSLRCLPILKSLGADLKENGEDGHLFGTIPVSNNLKHDLELVFVPHPGHVHLYGMHTTRRISNVRLSDALLLCNQWNEKHYFPKVFVDPSRNLFIAESSFLLCEKMTNREIKGIFSDFFVDPCGEFFQKTEKDKTIFRKD